MSGEHNAAGHTVRKERERKRRKERGRKRRKEGRKEE
jgi:hypothetical protein